MTDTEKINIAIMKSKKTKREIAQILGISEMGLYKKINAQTEFKASEIPKLCNVLDLTSQEMTDIFFKNRVRQNEK